MLLALRELEPVREPPVPVSLPQAQALQALVLQAQQELAPVPPLPVQVLPVPAQLVQAQVPVSLLRQVRQGKSALAERALATMPSQPLRQAFLLQAWEEASARASGPRPQRLASAAA